jgi:hemolysin III
VAALVALLRHPAGLTPGVAAAAATYAMAMFGVYFCSTMSHAVYEPRRRNRWRAWDQGVIYCLIAGTYTPFIYCCSPAGWATPLLGVVWLAAASGLASKVLLRHRVNGISTVTYLLLGWLPAIPLVAGTPLESLVWMVAGGLAYTVGILFLIHDSRHTYYHAAWHLMVIAGSACHFIAIYRLLYRL